ncbi:MAG: hypothetical protein K0R39_4555, partial [Symbiobacteriaceae bacterium]|nr:hypothetical protein [Symbiobacteriaceae bacterium]
MIAAHTLTRQGRGSLRFILGLRWVLLFTTPFMFGVSAFGSGRSTIWPILFIFGLSNLGLHLRNRAQPKGLSPWVWYATFAFDLLLVTMVVIQRGGIRTDAYLLYVLIVSEAGILVTKREAWVVGLVALAAYTGSVLWVNGPPELGRVFIRVVYLGMIALATNYLAAAEKRALTAALTDAKTNLPNARLFQEA